MGEEKVAGLNQDRIKHLPEAIYPLKMLVEDMKFLFLEASLGLLVAVGLSTSIINISKAQTSVTPTSKLHEVAQNSSRFHPDSPRSNVFRDYGWTTPLPETGKVTIRRNLTDLSSNQVFKPCPAYSALYAFAESTNYQVEVCTKEHTLNVPKYYFGQAKDGSGKLTIVNENQDEASQLIFKNNGYTYDIFRDGAKPEQINAYLEVKQPDNKIYAEALLYLYEKLD